MAREKILVVDDERKIVDLVRMYLEKDGYRVLAAYDGRQAVELSRRERPALVVLDLNLPEVDGLEVCRAIRRESAVPIVMLTARDEDTDKILGLELGADDYVTKPFSPRELVARVRAVLRRTQGADAKNERIEAGDIVVDLPRHEARRSGEVLDLTPTEFRLLEVMAGDPGRVFTRLQLLDRVQGEAYEGYERTIDVHVKNLRQKLEKDSASPRYIITVHGVGYKFSDHVA
jgi:two-component system alkaline phosphatase synthesis response regulator PhoP